MESSHPFDLPLNTTDATFASDLRLLQISFLLFAGWEGRRFSGGLLDGNVLEREDSGADWIYTLRRKGHGCTALPSCEKSTKRKLFLNKNFSNFPSVFEKQCNSGNVRVTPRNCSLSRFSKPDSAVGLPEGINDHESVR